MPNVKEVRDINEMFAGLDIHKMEEEARRTGSSKSAQYRLVGDDLDYRTNSIDTSARRIDSPRLPPARNSVNTNPSQTYNSHIHRENMNLADIQRYFKKWEYPCSKKKKGKQKKELKLRNNEELFEAFKRFHRLQVVFIPWNTSMQHMIISLGL